MSVAKWGHRCKAQGLTSEYNNWAQLCDVGAGWGSSSAVLESLLSDVHMAMVHLWFLSLEDIINLEVGTLICLKKSVLLFSASPGF